MRIAYAIHGYGRGHAARAGAVLPRLVREHQVLVLAGGDAHAALWPEFEPMRIPTLGFAYGKGSGERSNVATFKRNLPAVIDLAFHGPVFKMVGDMLEDFGPDVLISDAEAWSHHVARHLGIPRISIDHIGIMEYCAPPLDRKDRLESQVDRWCYRQLMCNPERVIVSSFFDAPARRPGVLVVGTLARQAVREAESRRGQHVVAYLNKGGDQLPHVLEALRGVGCPVHVYGTNRRDSEGLVHFRPASNLPFVEDLAGCRAVISTAGNQLMGEAIWLGKPMLVMPERCVEQRMNGAAVERLGIGMRTTVKGLTAGLIRRFLEREGEFVEAMKPHRRDGLEEAMGAMGRFIGELCPGAGKTAPMRDVKEPQMDADEVGLAGDVGFGGTKNTKNTKSTKES